MPVEQALMDAAVIHAHGKNPKFEQFPKPEVQNGEVLVQVKAAGLHPLVRARASGQHYTSDNILPFVPGVDGVGVLSDGKRVYFNSSRSPFGTMAQYSVTYAVGCVPLPANLDDAMVAGIINPGMAAWLAITWRAQLQAGETVLILGATGTSGQLAVQLAKSLGAGRVIAAGRNKKMLQEILAFGADATIDLDQSPQEITEAIKREVGNKGLQVIIDYIWGKPAEAAIAAIESNGQPTSASGTRLVQIGNAAGQNITLPAHVLRSSGLVIYGTGIGTVSPQLYKEKMPEFFNYLASGKPQIEIERVSLAQVEQNWQYKGSESRVVFVV